MSRQSVSLWTSTPFGWLGYFAVLCILHESSVSVCLFLKGFMKFNILPFLNMKLEIIYQFEIGTQVILRNVHLFDFDLWIDVKKFEKGSVKWHLLAFQYKGSHGKPRDGSLEIGDTNRFCKENDWFDKSFSQSQQKWKDLSFFLIWPKNGRCRSRSVMVAKL